MNATFEKASRNTASPECLHLCEMKQRFQDYTVITEKLKCKKRKQTYKGLKYNYMKWYILNHSKTNKIAERNFEILENAIMIGERQDGLYGKIKQWFFYHYPEIKENGLLYIPEYNESEWADAPIIIEEDAPTELPKAC